MSTKLELVTINVRWFVAVKTPAIQSGGGLQATRLKLSPLIAGLRAAGQLLHVVKHNMVKTLASFLGCLAGKLGDLFVY